LLLSALRDFRSFPTRRSSDLVGWPLVGITDFGWEKFLRYRIDPAFYKSDVVVLMNLSRWNQLSANARQILQETIAAYERTSYRLDRKSTRLNSSHVKISYAVF